jgi:hypothetical protein
MIVDDATAGVDLQSDAEVPARPSSDVAFAEAAIAVSTVTPAGLGAVNDSDAGVHDMEKQGDDTSEGSKKKKEPVFIHGVELVDLDDCDILDRRLQCDNEDTDEGEKDVDDGAPSSVQTVGPSSSIALALVLAVVPI